MENLINIQQEIWVDIANFENYEVSNYGNIRNKLNYKILKQSLNTYGYYPVMLRKNEQRQQLKIHMLIALHFIPKPLLAKCVDHIDNNPKNNQISNLRWASNSQNQMNRQKSKNLSSQFKGVYFVQNLGKWHARITINRQKIHLGYFTNQEEAARQYDLRAIELFQEFAKFNFPLENYQQQNNQQ